jgi:hypothetical protein
MGLISSAGILKCKATESLDAFPSVDNFKAFRKKVKHIVNNSSYGAKVKAEKLAPIVRGWRNYHRYCKMDGSRFLAVSHRKQSIQGIQ